MDFKKVIGRLHARGLNFVVDLLIGACVFQRLAVVFAGLRVDLQKIQLPDKTLVGFDDLLTVQLKLRAMLLQCERSQVFCLLDQYPGSRSLGHYDVLLADAICFLVDGIDGLGNVLCNLQ